jgi:hypothetical protein
MRPDAVKRTLRIALLWGLFSFLVNGLLPLSQWYALSPLGNGVWLSLSVLLVFPALFALAVVPVSAVVLALGRFRSAAAWRVVGAWLGYCVAFVVCIRASREIRVNGMAELAWRSQPLVEALRTFERVNGHPPAELSDLVPGYLAAVPRTGLGAYPDWVLKVDTPAGLLDFDELAYFPNQKYAEAGQGGWWERVNDWAYLHE